MYVNNLLFCVLQKSLREKMYRGVDSLAHALVVNKEGQWVSKDATAVVRDHQILMEKKEASKAKKKLLKINKRVSMQ